jgi:aminoglycoside phosphotransferase (APT) family kinase protein
MRRLDWRFLLPDPRLGSVAYLGRPSPLLAALREAAPALSVVGGRETAERARPSDLVVLREPAGTHLAEALRWLRPGGWLYLEGRGGPGARLRGARLGCPSQAASALRALGLRDLRAHWHWPDFERCAELVPLDQDSLARALARRRVDGPARLKVALALRLAERGSLADWVPCFSLVARRPAAVAVDAVPSTASAGSLIDLLAKARPALGFADPGAPLSCALVTPRFRASSHVVALVGPQGAARAALVVKAPRLAVSSRFIERELANLRALEARGVPGVPRALASVESWGRSIAIQSALDARPLERAVVRRDPERWCAAVEGWLAGLQAATAPHAALDAERLALTVERPLRRLAEQIGATADEERALAETLALAERLAGLPTAFEHGDLSPPNVTRRSGGGVGVLDWELAEPEGLPLCDLLFFLTYVAFARARRTGVSAERAAFEQAFFDESGFAAARAAAQAEALGIPSTALTPLLVLGFARTLSRLAGRLAPEGEGLAEETRGWLRANRYYVLWRHALAEQDRLRWPAPGAGR